MPGMTSLRLGAARILVVASAVVAVPRAASGLTLRKDHPRILFGDATHPGTPLSTYKTRCTSDAAYKSRCQGGITNAKDSLYPALGHAAGYLANGDAAACTAAYDAAIAASADMPGSPDAHSFISNNGRNMLQMAAVRDWCDAVLSAAQKKMLEDRMVAWADWYLGNDPGDVFHDDMANVWNSIALAGLALSGTAQDAKAATYLAAADRKWKAVILPAMAYTGDWWHEGFTYVQPTLGSLAIWAAAWTTATDDDVFKWAKTNASDLFEGYIHFHAYALRPDGNYFYFGDSSDNKQSVELFSRWLVDLLTTFTGSAVGQGLSIEIGKLSRPGYDYAGANGWMIPLFYDAAKDAAATPRSALPLARWLGKGASDVAILRSGWGKDDMVVMISCGDYFSSHGHVESGGFQIFQKAQLTGNTGYYDSFDTDHWQNYYAQHSVHANTLSIVQPGEFFPTNQALADKSKNVNDGGQRIVRRNDKGTGFPPTDLDTYKKLKTTGTKYEMGDITKFAAGGCKGLYDYVACDVTAAYTSAGFETNGNNAKVKEVTRQFVFIRNPPGAAPGPPRAFVVFDRVESADAAYEKRLLVHSAAAPALMGSRFQAGELFGLTVLPKDVDITAIDGFRVAGVPHPPTSAGRESWGTRVEVSPKKEAARDYFFHVFVRGSLSSSAVPSATVTSETAADVTVSINDFPYTHTLVFSKSGPPGGHFRGVSDNLIAFCDEDLGATGGGADGGAGDGGGGDGTGGTGGGSGDGGGQKDGGSGDGGSAASGDSSCGCDLGARSRSHGAAVALGALALVLGRRRRTTALLALLATAALASPPGALAQECAKPRPEWLFCDDFEADADKTGALGLWDDQGPTPYLNMALKSSRED